MSFLEKNFDLSAFHTFRAKQFARFFYFFRSQDQIIELQKLVEKGLPSLKPLGEGSNILFVEDFQGCIISLHNKGINVLSEDNKYTKIEVQAGENWESFVSFCVENQFSGIENLSLIPGSVGASPVQNIGAYGVELAETFDYCYYFSFEQKKIIRLNKDDCEFAYRDSIFKNGLKNKGVILSVIFKLNKKFEPRIEYGNIRNQLKEKKITYPSMQQMSDLIIEIRKNKLPDPKKNPNCGSFFKNPIISHIKLLELSKVLGDIPHYVVDKFRVKVPAAYLIEKSELKGLRKGNVSTWKNQPLVIVSNGKASGKEIFDFSEFIIQIVREKTSITLQREVTII